MSNYIKNRIIKEANYLFHEPPGRETGKKYFFEVVSILLKQPHLIELC